MGLYQRLRPQKFDDVVGQDHVVGPLRKMVENDDLPSLILLGGPAGVGKTTIARIVCNEMVGNPELNFIEVNAGADGGVDKVRAIKDLMHPMPLGSNYKIWLIDEAHQCTASAQQAFLKETEDTPKHVKFIFSSSEPDKLTRALQTRASRFDLRLLSDEKIEGLVRSAMASERIKLGKAVVSDIVASAEGSARQALVLLEQAAAADSDAQAMEVVQRAGPSKESHNLCKILLEGTWEQAREALSKSDKDAEGIRRGVIAYMSKGVLQGWLKGPREVQAMRALRRFQFLAQNGMPDLVLMTWEYFKVK